MCPKNADALANSVDPNQSAPQERPGSTLPACSKTKDHMGRVKRIWYLSPMRAAKVQASLRIRAVSPEPLLLAHTSSESRGTLRQKARSLAPLNGWACTVTICHHGMLENTNSLDAAHIVNLLKLGDHNPDRTTVPARPRSGSLSSVNDV